MQQTPAATLQARFDAHSNDEKHGSPADFGVGVFVTVGVSELVHVATGVRVLVAVFVGRRVRVGVPGGVGVGVRGGPQMPLNW